MKRCKQTPIEPTAVFSPASRAGSEDDDSRVIQALQEYQAALKAGHKPNRREFQARYPDISAALAECLDGLEFVHAVAPHLSQPGADPLSAPLSADLAQGGTLGDYRLIREVGRGGMGIVYEAEQISLNRRVALKMLPFASTLDARQLQRFKNEAQAAAGLHHTNIVPVFATGCERGVHYYAMQYIEGQTLAATIADSRLQIADLKEISDGRTRNPDLQPSHASANLQSTICNLKSPSTEHSLRSAAYFRTVANLGVQAAEALEHAHDEGIIHRDIKPANLLVDGRGKVWITDFGLAHCQSQAGLTMTGDLVGTLRYMSPEQALAKRVLVDQRTDIYSLGATLYELLTLEPIFAGADRQELLRQIAFEEPRSPRRHNKSIPAELETIVSKALEKNPADRYATAQDLADDLRRFLEDKPIRARRPTLVHRAVKWGRRHRSLVWSACIISLILATGLGWLLRDWQARRTEAESRVAQALETAEQKLREGNPYDPELISVVRQAEAQLASGLVGDELRRQVEQASADLSMLGKLEDIRLAQANQQANQQNHQLDWGAADPTYAQAFEKYGINVDASVEEAAAQIKQRPIGLHLAAALDNWYWTRKKLEEAQGNEPPQDRRWQRLLQIAQAADPDPWRGSLREALAKGEKGTDELKKLAAKAPIPTLAPTTVVRFAGALWRTGEVSLAVELLRQSHRINPADLWINHDLGVLLCYRINPPRYGEGIGFFRAALAVRPKSALVRDNLAGAHNNLGVARQAKGELDEAILCYREAIGVSRGDDSQLHIAYTNLGQDLRRQGKLPQAVEACREAIRLKPDCADAHNDMGAVLADSGRWDEAIKFFEKAIGFDKKHAKALNNLGVALTKKKRLDEAIARFREAIRITPKDANPYHHLVTALVAQDKLGEAVEPCRIATELDPDNAKGHYNLGTLLGMQGRPAEAEAPLRRAIELNPDDPDAYNNLVKALLKQQKFSDAEVVCRQANTADMYQELGVALFNQHKVIEAERAFRNAIQVKPATETYALLARALAGQKKRPQWEDAIHEWQAAVREAKKPFDTEDAYSAACDAAIFAQAEDVPALERARLRGQALTWLRACLTDRQKTFARAPDRQYARVLVTMQHWQRDSDLNAVRGSAALLELPESERQDWRRLWEEVASLAQRAEEAVHGFVQSWLVLSEALPYEGRDGTKALDQLQISGEVLRSPRAGDDVWIGGKNLTWREHHFKGQSLDFLAIYGSPCEYKLTYAACYVYADADRTDLALRVGSDDQAMIYLNGKQIYRQSKGRDLGEEDEVKLIALRKGANVIVFKVVNEPDQWGARLRFVEKDGGPAKGLRFGLEPE